MVIPNGLQKRPPVSLLGRVTLNGHGRADALIAEIPRGDPSTDVTLVLNSEGGSIKPYLFLTADPTQTAIPVAVTALAQAYLDSSQPSPVKDLRVCSVEDFTFIVNRTVLVQNGASISIPRPFETLLWVKTGQYARHYHVEVTTPTSGGAIIYDYAPSTGASGADANGVGTDRIAQALFSATVVSGSGGSYNGPSGGMFDSFPGMGIQTCVWQGSTIYFASNTADYTVTSSDDQGGTAMITAKGFVQNFSDLPQVAYDGFVARVLQSQGGQGNSDFYVQFTASVPPNGAWKECLAPGSSLGVNPHTLPVALTLLGSVWTLDVQPWKPRATGDELLNPDPGFVNDRITDVRWYRGRLELVYNGGVIYSDSADPFNYYTTTLAASLDSDPFGFLTPVDRKTFFKRGLTFDNRSVLFADKVQAIVSSTGPFTASNSRIDLLGEYAFNDNVPPQTSNHRAYLTGLTSGSMLVYELAIDRLSGLALITELTTAVPTLLPTTADRATTLEALYITLYGTSGATQIYLHVPRYQDQTRVQNGFYTWNLPSGFTLAGMFFKSTLLYLLMLNAADGNLYRATMELAPGTLDQGGTIRTFLDLKVPDTACGLTYTADTDTTAVVLPAGVDGTKAFASVRGSAGANGYPEGYIIPITAETLTTVTFQGNWTGGGFYVGYLYDSYMVPTQWFYVNPSDPTPQHSGRYSVKRMKIDVSNFGAMRVEVSIAGRATRTTTFEGVYQEDPTRAGLDLPPNSLTRVLDVPIGGHAPETSVKIANKSHLGFKMLGYELYADWTPRARRTN